MSFQPENVFNFSGSFLPDTEFPFTLLDEVDSPAVSVELSLASHLTAFNAEVSLGAVASVELSAQASSTEVFERWFGTAALASIEFIASSAATAHVDILGFSTTQVLQTLDEYYLADELNAFSLDQFPYHASRVTEEFHYNQTLTSVQPLASAHWAIDPFLVNAYKQDYYYRVHITPANINLGSLMSEQTRSIEVWNAWEVAKTLASIGNTSTESISLIGPAAPPTTYEANEFRDYTLAVSTDGPPIVDAKFTFNFTGESPTLTISGTRVILFSIPPNWKSKVKERLEWLTDVIEARDGGEQRFKLRQNPRQTMEYEALLLPDTLPLYGSFMAGWHSRLWGYPLWFHEQRLDSPVVSGATTINCVTAGYEFIEGGYAVLYASPTQAESFRIKSIAANQIVCDLPIEKQWPAGAMLYPMRFGYIKDVSQSDFMTGEVSNATMQFYSEQHRHEAVFSWPATYRGKPVLEIEPNWEGTRQERWQGTVDVFDATIGRSLINDRLGFARAARTHRLTALNRAKIRAYRNILNYAEGRWKEFYAPTYNRDIVLAENVLATQNFLTVKAMNYALLVRDHELRRHIRIALKTGQIYYCRINASDAVNTPAGTERLFLDMTFSIDFTVNMALISFMPLSRMESDIAEIDWISPDINDMTLTTYGTLK